MVPEGPSGAIPRNIKQKQRRLRGAEIDELAAGHQAGTTVYELAAEFGVHRHTMSEILERRGVSRRYQKLSPEQIDAPCALYKSGFLLTKIAHQLGRRAKTVRQTLMKAALRSDPGMGDRSRGGHARSASGQR